MRQIAKLFVSVVVVCGLSAALLAQPAAAPPPSPAATAQLSAQNKLLAARAARADAMRKLAERINGLFITSETHVKDFVTESDTIQAAMTSFLLGAREKGSPKYMEDGTCEVTMEVTMVEVVANLKQISNRYYKGNKFKAEDFEQMTVTNKETVLTETGMGAPRPEPAPGVPVTQGSLESLTNMSGAAKAYWLANVTPQGRLMAVRAGRVDGMRRLAERISGVFINSQTTVKDFVAQSDDINVGMATFLQGAREKSIRYHEDEPIVDVEMVVTLRTVYASLKSWGERHYKGDSANIRQLEELTVQSKDTDITETGSGVPPANMMKGGTLTAVAITAAQSPNWISQKIRATGNAAVDNKGDNAAQAKLMAFRAAELDARRKLAEQIDGLMITSSTSVRDFVAQNDQIETGMLTFQQGAHVLDESKRVLEDGTAEVTVEIELQPLWDTILYYEKKLSITVK